MGMCGTDCAPSTSSLAPFSWQMAAISFTGCRFPNTFEAWVIATSFVFSFIVDSNSSRSNKPYLSVCITETSTSLLRKRIHGRKLEWCSRMVVTTLSPLFQLVPQATMLMVSVVFFVRTVVPFSPPMNRAIFWCACQYFCDAIFARRCTPLPTLAR